MRWLLTVVIALAAAWAAFVVLLFVVKPDDASLRDTARLLPDTVRLVRRLAADRAVPRSARWPVWLLLGYLLFPIDVVPDFLPVVGYADDAILVALVLRRLVRRSGPAALERNWPGTPEGLAQLRAALRIPE